MARLRLGDDDPLDTRIRADHRSCRATRVVCKVLEATLPAPAAPHDVFGSCHGELILGDPLEHTPLGVWGTCSTTENPIHFFCWGAGGGRITPRPYFSVTEVMDGVAIVSR